MSEKLAHFAVQCSALEEWVKLNLFKSSWGAEALFVASGSVARGRLTFCFGFCTFEDYDFSWHGANIVSEKIID